jgi:hypothetical protein
MHLYNTKLWIFPNPPNFKEKKKLDSVKKDRSGTLQLTQNEQTAGAEFAEIFSSITGVTKRKMVTKIQDN